MAQLDIATYSTQVFWLIVVGSIFYGVMVGKGGVVKNMSRMLKVRRKRLDVGGGLSVEGSRKEVDVIGIVRSCNK